MLFSFQNDWFVIQKEQTVQPTYFPNLLKKKNLIFHLSFILIFIFNSLLL